MKMKPPTEASLSRYNLACKLVSTLTDHFYKEVVLTGASAKGIADHTSDIKISFWSERLPSTDQRVSWLNENGVHDVAVIPQPRRIESYLITGIYENIPLSTTWQTVDVLTGNLNMIINANTTDHRVLCLADIVLSAVSLQGGGVLEYWQDRLSYDYSDVLQTRLIQDSFAKWGSGKYDDDALVLRAVFALNRVWEVNWERWEHEADRLRYLPADFKNRLYGGDRQHLILDLLHLIQSVRPDLSGFIGAIKARMGQL